MNKVEILKRCFTEKNLNLILSFCQCEISSVRVAITQKSYIVFFPYFVLTSFDFRGLLLMDTYFSVDSDSLVFIFDI